MALVTSAITAWGGAYARIAQTAFVFGSSAAALTLLSSPWLRAWIRVNLAKHLFRHRSDSRAAWVRFRSEAPTSELQSLLRISYAFFSLKKKYASITT